MAKIIAKANLVLGTNLKLHIADKGDTDIVITDNADGTGTITSTTTDFTASSETAGLVNKPIVVGDLITISHSGEPANEGMRVTATTVSANSISYDDTADGALTSEAAGADINLTTFKKTYQYLEASGLSFVDGVSGIVLASVMVDLWDATDLDIYDPAFTSIEPRAKSLASYNGWEFHDTDTLKANRDTAFEYRETATSAASKIFTLLRSGDLNETTDQFTFWADSDLWDTAPTLAVTTGYINELVEIYDIAGSDNTFLGGGVTWFARCAEPYKTIIMENFTLDYAEIIPVAAGNALDTKLTHTDVEITTASSIWELITFSSDLDGVHEGDVQLISYDFFGNFEGDNQTNETVHEKINWMLRQPTDINEDVAGTEMRGDKQYPKSYFIGEEFYVDAYLTNYSTTQRNDLTLIDTTDNNRKWDISASLTVNAGSLAVGGTMSLIHADTFGTSLAVYLQAEGDINQKDITIADPVGITISYSTYAVDGHTPGQPIDVILSFNRPGFIEPDNIAFTLSGDTSVSIVPKADPSYIA